MPAQDAHANSRLHDETLSELGLSEQPFLEDKKRQPMTDAEIQKTRGALEQQVRFGNSLHLLIGEDGAGKTVLLQQLLKHCKNSIKPFVVKGSEQFQAKGFLHAVLNDLLNGDEQTLESLNEYIEALVPIFEQVTDDHLNPLLIIDDAHDAPMEEIAFLVDALEHFENEDGKTARLLLTGTPALGQAIDRFEAQFEELQLNHSTTTMQPLDESRTKEYLSSKLHQAGFADAFPFTDKAITKIQRESAGLPGRINSNAANYLNGVYRGQDAAGAKASWLSSVEWPVLLVGAAAIGAIGLGLTMFFGDEPEADVITVLNTEDTVVEQPIVSPTAEPAVVSGAGSETSSLPATPLPTSPPTTPLVQPLEQDSLAGDAVNNGTVADNTLADAGQRPKPTVDRSAISAQPGTNTQPSSEPLVLPEPPTRPQAETRTITTNDLPNENNSPTEFIVPAPAPGQSSGLAENKGVGNPDLTSGDQLSDNNLLDEPEQIGAATPNGNSSNNNSSLAINEPVADPLADLIDGDTDAAADAPLDNSPTEETIINQTEPAAPNRAIENERWVLFQSPVKFTVQLATSRERSYIIELAQTMDVQDPVAIYPFLTTNSNNPVFGLLSGLYDTRSEAIAAVEEMNDEAKKFGVWIRPVSDLQADIKRRN